MPHHIKDLFRGLAIYGVGDVATSLVSLLLLPVFVRYLTPDDYGIITMLLSIEAVAKVAFRWGVDTAFIRLYYDCAGARDRQRLASTIFIFLLAANGSLLLAAFLASDWIAAQLLGSARLGVLVALTLANTFVSGFFFLWLQVLRIERRPQEYVAITVSRSLGTVVARLVLVMWSGLGVLGIVLADIVVTTGIAAVITWYLAPLIRPVFSRRIIREALGFGLPRIPHSIAHQVMGFADRYFLRFYRFSLADVGIYSIGATFGLALKYFLSAFEAAWTPFFLGVMHEPEARRIYASVTSYVVGILVLLVAGLSALAPDVVRLMTTAAYYDAARVTPWFAVGVLFQGLYLVGSIGLIITKRTTFYPVATGLAAAVSVLSNASLIPSFGILGAAWANVLAYATLAVATSVFSWRVYPIPYEWGRLLRIGMAGLLSYLVGAWIPLATSPFISLPVRGVATAATYVVGLYLLGCFRKGELQALTSLRDRVLRRAPVQVPALESSDVEMAGEIVATTSPVTRDSRDQDR